MICFLGSLTLGDRPFVEDFELDEKEILSMDSDLNESTSLWWIKTGLS